MIQVAPVAMNAQTVSFETKVPSEEKCFLGDENSDLDDDLYADIESCSTYMEEIPLWKKLLSRAPSYSRWKHRTIYFLDSAKWNFSVNFDDVLMVATLYVLFEADLTDFALPRAAVPFINFWVSVSFVLFLLEMTLNCWAKTQWRPNTRPHGYLFSFFFWLDLLAIISLFPDIPWIAVPLGISTLSNPLSGDGGSKWGSTGTKAARVLRMVRLVRLVRIYKIMVIKRRHKQLLKEMDILVHQGIMTAEEAHLKVMEKARQSKVGAELSDITMRRVIVGVFLMICFVPLLTYQPIDWTKVTATRLLHNYNVRNNTDELNLAITRFMMDLQYYPAGQTYLVNLVLQPGDRCYINIDTSSMRPASVVNEFFQTGIFLTSATFSVAPLVQQSAYLGFLLTWFILFMLAVAILTFNADAQRLVLAPIERMMEVVQAVSEDPLVDFEELNEGSSDYKRPRTGEYETRLLETTITKITGLLRVGFGVAGAEIISKNISLADSSSKTMLDPMVPGKKVYAIIGFCDIHKFELITERLFGEVMTFVNNVAEVVHSNTSDWAGSCNKNLGNAFIIVWRIGEEEEVKAATKTMQTNGAKKHVVRSMMSGLSQHVSPPVIRRSESQQRDSLTVATDSHKLSRERSRVFLRSPQTPSSETVPARFNTDTPSPSQHRTHSVSSRSAHFFPSVHSETQRVKYVPKIDLRRLPGLDMLADKAVIGFLKVIIEIQRNKSILRWSEKSALNTRRSEKFKLQMGFGLHCGWAIEGAVGSQHKVDATYLSPHVNMAARMETASRQYGTPLLLTESVHELMTEEGRGKCRKIDVVTVKGSIEPVPIYTYDCFFGAKI